MSRKARHGLALGCGLLGMAFAVPRRMFLEGAPMLLGVPPAGAESWFDVIWGLKTEERVLEGQEKEVEEDLKKEPWSNFLDRARLMNLEAVLKAEEDTVKKEEKDVERSASRGKVYESDEKVLNDFRRLQRFGKLEDRLRFNNEETSELSELQRKLR